MALRKFALVAAVALMAGCALARAADKPCDASVVPAAPARLHATKVRRVRGRRKRAARAPPDTAQSLPLSCHRTKTRQLEWTEPRPPVAH